MFKLKSYCITYKERKERKQDKIKKQSINISIIAFWLVRQEINLLLILKEIVTHKK